jgi:putative transposase
MDGKSRWADNIMIERWFRSLKVEELYPNEYTTPKVLRKAISDYIRQYNNERPHEALAYKKPADVFNGCFVACTTESIDLDMAS